MQLREIISRENTAVKEYVRLSDSRKARRESGCFVTEGLKLTAEALAAGCGVRAVYVTRQALDHYDTLARWVSEGVDVCVISDPVADKMADAVSPQGIFGVFTMLDKGAQPAKISRDGKYLLLCGLQDPGNIGAILRTAAAFGMDGIYVSDDCPDLYSRKVLRATMGGVFKLPWLPMPSPVETVAELRAAGVMVYATALTEGATDLRSLSMEGGCAALIGNEGGGLPSELIDCCDGAVLIPMRPDSESLNAAMAAGIVMWEMKRQTL